MILALPKGGGRGEGKGTTRMAPRVRLRRRPRALPEGRMALSHSPPGLHLTSSHHGFLNEQLLIERDGQRTLSAHGCGQFVEVADVTVIIRRWDRLFAGSVRPGGFRQIDLNRGRFDRFERRRAVRAEY